MKLLLSRFLPIAIISLALINCDTGFNPAPQDPLEKMLDGTASGDDIKNALESLPSGVKATGGSEFVPDSGSILTMPSLGQLFVTLRDNDAGWQSELYLEAGTEQVLLFEDTRQGPLDVTSQYAYLPGTGINFYLVTHTPAGQIIHHANSNQAQVSYDAGTNIWTIGFEDVPADHPELGEPDWDYNDAVIEVRVETSQVVDLSNHFNISIDYLNHHGYTPEGYVIYYIGETVFFDVNINVTAGSEYFNDSAFVVYAIQEYFDNITSVRTWYPSPPRPIDEPMEVTVTKGQLLPNQSAPQTWPDLAFSEGAQHQLSGTYTSNLEIAAGNDQTHIIIVRKNASDQIELTVFDNPETGVFDPPAF